MSSEGGGGRRHPKPSVIIDFELIQNALYDKILVYKESLKEKTKKKYFLNLEDVC